MLFYQKPLSKEVQSLFGTAGIPASRSLSAQIQNPLPVPNLLDDLKLQVRLTPLTRQETDAAIMFQCIPKEKLGLSTTIRESSDGTLETHRLVVEMVIDKDTEVTQSHPDIEQLYLQQGGRAFFNVLVEAEVNRRGGTVSLKATPEFTEYRISSPMPIDQLDVIDELFLDMQVSGTCKINYTYKKP